MKRLGLTCAVLLAVAVGCDKTQIPQQPQGDGSVTLKAFVETDMTADDDSRAAVRPDPVTRKIGFVWSGGDAVAVNTSNGFVDFTLVGPGGSAKGTFAGTVEGRVGRVAVYPAEIASKVDVSRLTVVLPAEYSSTGGRIDPPMWALVEESQMWFKHLGGLLMVDYSDVNPTKGLVNVTCARSLVVSVPGKKINGEYTVDLSGSYPCIALQDTDVESESRVRVTVSGSDDLKVYVPLPVGDYHPMSVWLEDETGMMIPGTLKTTTATKTISRNSLKDMPDVKVYNSYIINTREELLAFAPQDTVERKEIIQSLIINDPGCTMDDNDLSFVKMRVDRILGEFKVVGTNLTSTELFFKTSERGFTPEGSVIFENCQWLFNLNGMRYWTTIGGDLVFNNCPRIETVWQADDGQPSCLQSITSVKGSLRLIGMQTEMQGVTLRSLRNVGGDFHIESCNYSFFNFVGEFPMPLERIGGNLILRNNYHLNGLGGFEDIASVGGVQIAGNGTAQDALGGIPWTTSVEYNMVGFDLVQSWIDSGKVDRNNVSCSYANGTPVIFN